MKIFQAFSLLTIAHGSKVTRINFRKEGEGLGSRLGTHIASGPGRFLGRKNGLVQSVHACAKNSVK